MALAGLVRVLGDTVADIPLVCVRPEAQGLGLGRLLLRNLEAALIRRAAGTSTSGEWKGCMRLLTTTWRCGRCGVQQAVMPAAWYPGQQAPETQAPPERSEAADQEAEAPLSGAAVGYALAPKEEMQRLARLPLLAFPENPLLVKQLSAATLTKVLFSPPPLE